jgi:hypothetical protein
VVRIAESLAGVAAFFGAEKTDPKNVKVVKPVLTF